MNDSLEVGDRVMVLKGGENVGERAVVSTSEREALELIVSGVPNVASASAEVATG